MYEKEPRGGGQQDQTGETDGGSAEGVSATRELDSIRHLERVRKPGEKGRRRIASKKKGQGPRSKVGMWRMALELESILRTEGKSFEWE